MKRLLCIFGHDNRRRFILRPLGPDPDNPTVWNTHLREEWTCSRCGRMEAHEETVPFQYIVDDD